MKKITNTRFRLKIGASATWKVGLVTREVYRQRKNSFIITDTSSGWHEAEVDRKTLEGLIEGRVCITSLNWW